MEKKIYIDGKLAEISDELKVVVDKVVSEFRNPLKKTGSFSYTIKFPQTQRNKALFDFQGERSTIGKFRKQYGCSVEVGGVTVLEGEFHLNKIGNKAFEGFITDSKGGRLADILDSKKKLKEITCFEPIDFQGDRTVYDYLDMTLNANTSEIAFPYVADSFARLNKMDGGIMDGNIMDLGYEDFGVSHFTAAVFKNIFTDAGYTLDGEILNDNTFNRMLMLYSSDGSDPTYNYGALAPLTAYTGFRYYNIPSIHQGTDYSMYVITPEAPRFGMGAGPAVVGDECFSLGPDGVYTCKASGNYTFDIKVTSFVYDNGAGQPDVPTSQWLLFREISESQYSEEPGYPNALSSMYFDLLKDGSTLNSLSNNTHTPSGYRHIHTSNFTAKLTVGKQYQVQVYVGIHNSVNQSNLMFVADYATSTNCHLKITAMDGRQQLDPAKFLPDMTQVDFVNGIFKLYNLFYDIDPEENKITLYTRDEWFALNKNNITDISKRVNLDEFEETPLEESDVNETYYRWASDESDYLLTRTNYMDLINGDMGPDVYELPFAPLAFLRKKIWKMNGFLYDIDYDLIPVAIPDTEVVDATLLEDYSVHSNFSYKPKIAIYYGAGVMNDAHYRVISLDASNNEIETLYGITFGRSVNPLFGSTPWPGINFSPFTGATYKLMPKLCFFNIKDQPAYEVEVITATREFRVVQATGTTIYDAPNLTFLTSNAAVNLLDSSSVALLGDKSLFQKQYANDLLITNWSNYYEGSIKMDPVLFQNLSGKNIIRIADDLYLLAEVKKYEVGGNTAWIKVYKLISG